MALPGSYRLRDLVKRLYEEADKEEQRESGEDSLDDQVDRLFSGYLKEAKNSKNEGRSFDSLVRRVLREEDDEEEDDSDDEADDEPEKGTIEDVDVQSFANDVMRLVENYDTLLEIRNTLLRRASNYLSKVFEDDVVSAFEDALKEGHGVEIGVTDVEKETEFQAPAAAQAGPMGGGGGA